MPKGFDWEKAKRREKHRAGPPGNHRSKKRQQIRADALIDFAVEHHLRCFACNANSAEWAKSGINKRGPWIICVPCVNKRQADLPSTPIARP